MKCPLFYTGWLNYESEDMRGHTDCIKEECAWWNESESECVFHSMANWLPHLAKGLSSIAKELTLLKPPGGVVL